MIPVSPSGAFVWHGSRCIRAGGAWLSFDVVVSKIQEVFSHWFVVQQGDLCEIVGSYQLRQIWMVKPKGVLEVGHTGVLRMLEHVRLSLCKHLM